MRGRARAIANPSPARGVCSRRPRAYTARPGILISVASPCPTSTNVTSNSAILSPFLAGLAAALVSVLAYVMAQIASALTVRN
jgi:hypothetical protein